MSAYYNEIEPYAAQWLRNLIAAGHIAPGDVDERDIRDVKPSDLTGYTQCHFFAGIGGWSYALRLAGWPDDRPVWTGSCPCQPFSAAGKREGFDDPRHLWPKWSKLISECKPAIIFGEQVASAIKQGWLDAIFADMEAEGYACGATVLPACGVGAPHIRQRLWFVGVTNGLQPEQSSWSGAGPGKAESGRARCQPTGSSNIGELADSQRARLEGSDARALGVECASFERGGSISELGDPCSEGSGRDARAILGAQGEGAGERRGVGDLIDESESTGAAGELVDSTSEQVGLPGRSRQPRGTSWADAEFIPCTDGKARPVEPGTFPLAYGIPNRVGQLRAYGNAIVPQVAAEFIRAYSVER